MIFKVIRGGQTEPERLPKKFVKFDTKRARLDAIIARHYAQRDQAILRERAKQNQL